MTIARENVVKQATSLKDVPDVTLPGIAINTSPTDYRVRKRLQMMKFTANAGRCLGVMEDAGPG